MRPSDIIGRKASDLFSGLSRVVRAVCAVVETGEPYSRRGSTR
jgi:hypothetical protein